jgi:hypothetical protein
LPAGMVYHKRTPSRSGRYCDSPLNVRGTRPLE